MDGFTQVGSRTTTTLISHCPKSDFHLVALAYRFYSTVGIVFAVIGLIFAYVGMKFIWSGVPDYGVAFYSIGVGLVVGGFSLFPTYLVARDSDIQFIKIMKEFKQMNTKLFELEEKVSQLQNKPQQKKACWED